MFVVLSLLILRFWDLFSRGIVNALRIKPRNLQSVQFYLHMDFGRSAITRLLDFITFYSNVSFVFS